MLLLNLCNVVYAIFVFVATQFKERSSLSNISCSLIIIMISPLDNYIINATINKLYTSNNYSVDNIIIIV
ncbi:protein of unknown function [Clostridium beijerinckii]|nr:protein of unknown function [Clostridium beijerinckii]